MRTIEEISGNVNEIDCAWYEMTYRTLFMKLGLRLYDVFYR